MSAPARSSSIDQRADPRSQRCGALDLVAAQLEGADQAAQAGALELALDDGDAQRALGRARGHGLDRGVDEGAAGRQAAPRSK
ncbi:MAG: hypothetical protein HS111_23360 [Kofleriaceae bacterium]|nr:hypothetical protein [Kofleriaceae bacterium]